MRHRGFQARRDDERYCPLAQLQRGQVVDNRAEAEGIEIQKDVAFLVAQQVRVVDATGKRPEARARPGRQHGPLDGERCAAHVQPELLLGLVAAVALCEGSLPTGQLVSLFLELIPARAEGAARFLDPLLRISCPPDGGLAPAVALLAAVHEA